MDAQDPVSRPGFFGGLLSLAGRAVRPFERLARRVLGPDGDLKVLAVLAAVVVYGLVEPLSVGIERTDSVPVRVVPTDKSVAVVGVSPATVAVTLRGTSEEFTAFDADALRVEVATSPEKDASEDVLSVGPRNVTNVLDRLRVVGVSPSLVSVEYDTVMEWNTVNLVATPRRSGAPVQGTAILSIPTNFPLRVSGSKKKFTAFSAKGIRLPVDPVDVEGKTESFDTFSTIRPPEDSGITSLEPAAVPVHVEIRIRAASDGGEIRVSDPIPIAGAEAPKADHPASSENRAAAEGSVVPAGGPAKDEPAVEEDGEAEREEADPPPADRQP